MIFVLTFILAAMASFLFCGVMLRRKWGYRMMPDTIRSRDIHTQPKLRIGGLVIIPLFLMGLWLGQFTEVFAWSPVYIGLIIGGVSILIYGLIDERYDLPWYIQLGIQALIVLAVVASDIRIHEIRLPFIGLTDLGIWTGVLIGIPWYFPADFLAFIWIMVVMNVVNWLDGVDGLAGGVGVIGFVFLALLSLSSLVGQPHIAFLAIVLAGLYIGFLYFNFYPSKIFLGTYGSMFLGLMLAVLAMISGGKIATAALVLAFPIIDAIFVVFRRLRAGVSVFQADNRHFHHQLLRFGFSQRQAVLLLYSISLIFGILALTLHTQGKFFTFVAGAVALALVSGLISWKRDG